jgi:hypothetical protein
MNKHPIANISALKAGCDRFSITFGRGLLLVDDIYMRSTKRLGNNPNVYIHRNNNSSGYEMVVTVRLPLSKAKIYVGERNTRERQHKLEFAGSRMSDDDYMKIRSILIKIFGKEVLGDIYERGNISVAEFHVDCTGVNTGDLVPCNYSLKWSVYGTGSNIETVYWGNKLFKSYNKSKWFKSKLFTSQAQDHVKSGFICPSDVINRLERTVHNFDGAKKRVGFSPKRLVDDGYSPFDDVEFIDTRVFAGNPHFNSIDLMLLRIVGKANFMELCEDVKRALDVNSIDRLISSATRTGFGNNVNRMIKKSIQKLEFFSPEFNAKEHKENVGKPSLEYHHLGFVTCELLDLLDCSDDPFEHRRFNDKIQKHLYEVFGTTDTAMIAGKAITEKVAHKLLSLVQVVDIAE